MKIIDNRASSFSIVPMKQNAGFTKAAEILAEYLEKVTGCRLPVLSEPFIVNNCIVLDTVPFESSSYAVDGLGDEGYAISSLDGKVYICAAGEESLFYAVYDFLERYCGCLWLTSADDYIPSKDCIEIDDNTFVKEIPCMNYREVFYRDAWDKTFALKQKINGQGSYVENGRIHEGHRNWGFWCHSFFTLIPPDKYYAEHPEYFSLVDGQRINDGQLCCSNDEMIEEAIKNLGKFIKAHPEVKYWSVSQNDTAKACTCEKCRKLDEEAGSPIGSILYFVNKVAEAFPDKIISTLSYWYSRTAPKKISMRDNVHIMFCNIECDRSKPIPVNPQCESFRNDLSVWHEYCGNVFLWDYDIQFANLVSPFPNFHILADNMKFFYENNVRSIFNQANRENRGDFWALRAYLLAKLSWNPYCDFDKHYNEFISAYYGDGAKYIDEYIRDMTNELRESGEGLSIFGKPEKEGFITREKCIRYSSYLDNALAAVSGDSTLTLRVEEVKMGLIYAMLRAALYENNEEKEDMISFFKRVADTVGIERVYEWGTTVDEFIAKVRNGDYPEK